MLTGRTSTDLRRVAHLLGLAILIVVLTRAQYGTVSVPRNAHHLRSELLVVVVSAGYCEDSQRTDFAKVLPQ